MMVSGCVENDPHDISDIEQNYVRALHAVADGRLDISDSIAYVILKSANGDLDNETLGYGHLILGLYSPHGNQKERRAHAIKALDYGKASNDNILQARAYNVLGGYATLIDKDCSSAFMYQSKALEHARLAADDRLIMIIECNLSETYSTVGDTLGLRYARETYDLARKTNDKPILVASVKHLVQHSIQAGDVNTEILQRLEEISSDRYIYDWLRTVYYIAVDSLDKAQSSVKAALEDSVSGPEAIIAQAEILNRLGRWHESEQWLGKLKELDSLPLYDVRNIRSLAIHSDNCHNIAPEKESAALRTLDTAKDALSRQKDKIQINELRIQYDVMKKEAEIVSQRRKTRQIIWGSVIAFAIILSVSMSYYFYMRRRYKLMSIIVDRQRAFLTLKEAESRGPATTVDVNKSLSETTSDDIWRKIQEYIVEKGAYLDSNLSRESVAQAIGVNHTWLTKVVKERTGRTFPQFITYLRVEEATRLLKDNPKSSIEQIWQKSGFISRATFYKAFKDLMGMTPREFAAIIICDAES